MERRLIFFAALICLAGAACADSPKVEEKTGDWRYVPGAAEVEKKEIAVSQEGAALTAFDQSNDPGDLTITRDIRKMLMENSNLSVNAKNVQVITIDRKTTLRGLVDSEEEKEAVGRTALIVAGPGKVNNEIDVKKH